MAERSSGVSDSPDAVYASIGETFALLGTPCSNGAVGASPSGSLCLKVWA